MLVVLLKKKKKTDYNKCITTSEFNILVADVFNARLKQANLEAKTDFDDTISSFDSKIATNETKNESIENEFIKLKTFDLGYFIGKSHFEEYGAQNYLVFQPIKRYFKINGKYILSWQSKGLSNETIKPYATSDNSLTPLVEYYGTRVRVQFDKICLKQAKKLEYTYGQRVKVYTFYELGASGSNDSNPTLKNCLFGAVTLTKKMQVLKNIGILVMELDWIED